MKRIISFQNALAGVLMFACLAAIAAEPVTVIVPYNPAKPVAGQTPDQFYLPYERFLELWERAKQNRRPIKPEPAPIGFALNSARYEGRVEENIASFRGVLDLTVTNEAWITVPLPFKSVRTLLLDGAPAAFDGEQVVIEKPGRHRIEVEFEVPIQGAQLLWTIPQTAATMVVLTLPNPRTTARISPGHGSVEQLVDGVRTISAAVGSSDTVRVELGTAAAPDRVAEPALVTIRPVMSISSTLESTVAAYTFSFPQARQDRFTIQFEKGLALVNLEAVDLKSWNLHADGEKQALDLVLNEPASGSYSVTVSTERPILKLPSEVRAPLFSATARRIEIAPALLALGRVEITPLPGAGLREVPEKDPALRLVAAYLGNGELRYRVAAMAPMREAKVDYVYQVNRRKIELIASLQFEAKGEALFDVAVGLPAQFEIEAVESERLQEWWREGDQLHVRFKDATPATTPLVIYLVRLFNAAQNALEFRPLTLTGFKSITGEAVIAAHKGVEVGMQLAGDGKEIAPAAAATDFQILTPLERKRGLSFKTQNFSAQVTLTPLPEKADALWVMDAQAHENWVALNTKVRLSLKQGSLDHAVFTLPAALPEARVLGVDVRETRSRVEGDQRIYEVRFQNEIDSAVEFSFEVELANPGEVALPPLLFPEMHTASGYVLADNASDSEMKLKSSGVDPAPLSEIPWLPSLSNAAGIYRVQPNWSVTLGIERLEKASSRAAFCAWAEMTTAVRADGSEWHRATWHLQNRSLQFLPVSLPQGAQLMGARVAGKSVRADAGKVEGRDVILIPLIKTKPGDLSYDVEIVYRRLDLPLGWRTPRKWLAPELVGITVERTLWNVWLPEDRRLESASGNMEAVIGEMAQTEKLAGSLDELKKLSSLVTSSNVSAETKANARSSWSALSKEIERSNSMPQTGAYSIIKGNGALSEQLQTDQNDEVVNRRRLITSELEMETKRVAQGAMAEPRSANGPTGKQIIPKAGNAHFWAENKLFARPADTAGAAALATAPDANNLGLNDNVILQQRQLPAPPTSPVVDTPGQENRGQNYRGLSNARGNRLQTEELPSNLPAAVAVLPGAPAEPPNSTVPAPERLEPKGRVSLEVDFATEGAVYHFKKVKASALLEIKAVQPSVLSRWKSLGGFLLLSVALLGVRTASVRFVRRRRNPQTRPH
ncbi:MAG: hypothetical protein JWL59_1671 [Chthoniobacteraceae bacterium]|nr:hypothetical protein [Chthoniobacteraceae bacterium]